MRGEEVSVRAGGKGEVNFEKIVYTCHVVLNSYGTQNPKFYFDMWLFNFVQGLGNFKFLHYKGPNKCFLETIF